MRGDSYLHFLQNDLPEQLEDVPLIQGVTCTYSTMEHISGWEFSWTLGRKRRSYCLAP